MYTVFNKSEPLFLNDFQTKFKQEGKLTSVSLKRICEMHNFCKIVPKRSKSCVKILLLHMRKLCNFLLKMNNLGITLPSSVSEHHKSELLKFFLVEHYKTCSRARLQTKPFSGRDNCQLDFQYGRTGFKSLVEHI